MVCVSLKVCVWLLLGVTEGEGAEDGGRTFQYRECGEIDFF